MNDKQPIKLPVGPNGLIEMTITAMLEGLIGIASSEKKELVISAGHLLQRMRGVGFLGALQAEWRAMREKGRIKDDYADTDQHFTCLHELLDAMDNEIVDEQRFQIMKRVFFVASSEILSDRNDILPQQLMRIARSLTSGETIVLSTAHNVYLGGKYPTGMLPAIDWLKRVAVESGLRFAYLVELHERALIQKYLISPRHQADINSVQQNEFRLTDLGIEFCSFVAKYDDLVT